MDISMSYVDRARVFATAAHYAIGQTRKYKGEPYIVHPERVALFVAMTEGTSIEQICAAWLHDVVEDTKIPLSIIREEFGKDIAQLVDELTNVAKPEDGNREVRNRINLEHTQKASPAAKTVKLADVIANTEDIHLAPAEYGQKYLREKRALLEVLREGDTVLWNMAFNQINKGLRDAGDDYE